MKKYSSFILSVFLLISISSCSAPEKSVSIGEEVIKPGDSVGSFTINQSVLDLPYYYFRYYCDYLSDDFKPVSTSIDCQIPALKGLVIDIGWFAKGSKLNSNWEEIEWELIIDGHQVALEEFELLEEEYHVKGENNFARFWLIDLINITPGQHTLKQVQIIKNEISDGFNTYQPGRYEYQAIFTVNEKPTYPEFSPTAESGINQFSSNKAGLDFLFYLPFDYDPHSQKEWPLLIQLHGAPFRGGNLELLLEEDPLPRSLKHDQEFPFIFTAPIGDGGYEFWIEEKLTNSLFTLIEEIQSNYLINSSQIYLIGYDMGGNGVWQLGLNYPGQFTALVPIGGYVGYPFAVPENICDLRDVPVWAFHGGKDVNVPTTVEQDLVDALNECGGNARLTVYDDMTIDILYNVYKDHAVYEWLLSHSK
jgi:predicted esterase